MSKDKRIVTTLDCKNFVAEMQEEFASRSVNIVTNWRGGAPVAIHLNNLLPNSTLTLLKYQTYTGEHKSQQQSEVLEVVNDWDDRKKVTVFIDDIYDTGESSAKCVSWIKCNHNVSDVEERYIVSKDYTYTRNAQIFVPKDTWVVFPWEI